MLRFSVFTEHTKSCKPELLEKVLRFIYGGVVEFDDVEQVFEVIELADRFFLQALVDACMNKIEGLVTEERAWPMYKLARRYPHSCFTKLMSLCSKHIFEQWDEMCGDLTKVTDSQDADANLLEEYFTIYPARTCDDTILLSLIHWWNKDRCARLSDFKHLLSTCLIKEEVHVYYFSMLFDSLEPFVREDRDYVQFLANLTNDCAIDKAVPLHYMRRRLSRRQDWSPISVMLFGRGPCKCTVLRFTADGDEEISEFYSVEYTKMWNLLFGNLFNFYLLPYHVCTCTCVYTSLFIHVHKIVKKSVRIFL